MPAFIFKKHSCARVGGAEVMEVPAGIAVRFFHIRYATALSAPFKIPPRYRVKRTAWRGKTYTANSCPWNSAAIFRHRSSTATHWHRSRCSGCPARRSACGASSRAIRDRQSE